MAQFLAQFCTTPLDRSAVQICRNDFLSVGRMHFFFPDSRINLDLTTDKTLKEARFDRHFVRDMIWSRHQLEELAERRFAAAQDKSVASGNGADASKSDSTFTELFKEVRHPDLAPSATPRIMFALVIIQCPAFVALSRGIETVRCQCKQYFAVPWAIAVACVAFPVGGWRRSLPDRGEHRRVACINSISNICS